MPLHPQLIKEGFLDFVASKFKGSLFGEISPDRFGSCGGNAPKVLGRWVCSDIKIADPWIAPNHSFHHRLKDECRNAGLAKDVHDALTGHAAGDVGSTYGSGFEIAFLGREVSKNQRAKGSRLIERKRL